MRKLLLLLSLCISSIAYGQNYNCFTPGVRQFFVNSDTDAYYKGGYLRGMRIDSVRQVGTSAIYYPFRSIRGDYGFRMPDLDTNGGSWLGKKVVRQQDGTFLFDNYWGDTVIIKTQANVGDSWILYNDTTNWYYTATVIAIDTMAIAGVLDSVKSIKVVAYKNNTANISDPLNDLTIVLSKSHGFAQVCDLYMFPMHKPDSSYVGGFYNYGQHFDYYTDQSTNNTPNIFNLTFKLTDFHNPTLSELNGFNVGDEFEGFYYRNSPNQDHYHEKITNKWVSFNSVKYEVDNYFTFSVDNTQFFDSTFMPENYRMTMGISGRSGHSSHPYFFDQPADQGGLIYYYYPNDTNWCMTSDKYVLGSDFIYATSSGVQINTFEPCGAYEAFKVGFGYDSSLSVGGLISYSVCIDPSNVDNPYAQLTYIHKTGHPACGVGVATPESIIKQVQVYPNPAMDQLSIKLLAGYSYKIALINSIGEVLYTNANAKNTEEVNTHNIPTGIYIVLVTDEFGNSSNYKVVVQH